MMLLGKTVRYKPTANDALWLLRAVDAEGEPRNLVAQTLVNGFVWARESGGWRRDLATWVRAYAQPVNPRHFVTGDLFKKEHPNPTPEDLAKAARREKVHSTKVAFGEETRAAVSKALTDGPVIADATDYAKYNVDATVKGYEPRTGREPGKNRFWVRPGAKGWPGYRVAQAGGSAAVAVLLLGLAFAILRV